MGLSICHLRRKAPAWNVDTAISLGLICLAGTLLRFAFVRQPIRVDEANTVLAYASKPLYLALSLYNEPNNHFLHTLLVHLSMIVFGKAEWAVRVPAFLAGVSLPLLAYWFTSRLANKDAGFVAAALVACSSLLVEFSANARGYTMLAAGTLAILICGLETLRKASPVWFGLFALCAIGGAWTVPIFVLPLGGAVTWLLWETSGRSARFHRVYWIRLGVTLLAVAAGTAILYLPMVAVNGPLSLVAFHGYVQNQRVSALGSSGGPAALAASLRVFAKGNAIEFARVWHTWHRDLPQGWPLVACAAFLYAAASYLRLRRLAISLAGWVLLLVLPGHLVASARNWLMFLPLYLACASVGLARLGRIIIKNDVLRRDVFAWGSVGLALLLAVPVLRSGSIVASKETGVLPSAREIVDFFDSRQITSSQILCSWDSELPLHYYWWRKSGRWQQRGSVEIIEAQGARDGWLVVNKAYDETVGADAGSPPENRLEPWRCQIHVYGVHISQATVLEQDDFRGASVYHVSWEAKKPSFSTTLTSALQTVGKRPNWPGSAYHSQ